MVFGTDFTVRLTPGGRELCGQRLREQQQFLRKFSIIDVKSNNRAIREK